MATPGPEKREAPIKRLIPRDYLLPRKRLQLMQHLAEHGLYFALAEAVNREMTKEDLKTFAADATADFKETLLRQRYKPITIEAYQTAGTEAVDWWEEHGKKREAFDELATKLKASAEQVEKWKAIPESSSHSKRLAEEMVFACVEELGRTTKRLKERHRI